MHWLAGMCVWLDEALLKGAANPRSGLLPECLARAFTPGPGMPGYIGKPWFFPSRTELLLKI